MSRGIVLFKRERMQRRNSGQTIRRHVTAQGLLQHDNPRGLQVARLGSTTSPDGLNNHGLDWRGRAQCRDHRPGAERVVGTLYLESDHGHHYVGNTKIYRVFTSYGVNINTRQDARHQRTREIHLTGPIETDPATHVIQPPSLLPPHVRSRTSHPPDTRKGKAHPPISPSSSDSQPVRPHPHVPGSPAADRRRSKLGSVLPSKAGHRRGGPADAPGQSTQSTPAPPPFLPPSPTQLGTLARLATAATLTARGVRQEGGVAREPASQLSVCSRYRYFLAQPPPPPSKKEKPSTQETEPVHPPPAVRPAQSYHRSINV
ncbi:hypothetical protein B0I37DRAFT_130014 [Chaetomium sp. MPI-CAGE-AT-0009]|nr:hypothetical protein B0I37DRAFT_130014 [Chaetomium sp. MPI-CAGE-AT-0009]